MSVDWRETGKLIVEEVKKEWEAFKKEPWSPELWVRITRRVPPFSAGWRIVLGAKDGLKKAFEVVTNKKGDEK